jgi:hypothetical protein
MPYHPFHPFAAVCNGYSQLNREAIIMPKKVPVIFNMKNSNPQQNVSFILTI